MTMKLKMYLLAGAFGVSALALQSCNDDDNGMTVPTELQNALLEKYGDARRIEWGKKGVYYVADFDEGNYEKEAWFTPDGVWQMTETDIPNIAALPAPVKSAFESSEYASWHVDDIDKLERKDMETVYVIEVEQGKQEVDLYYSENGILIKEVVDAGDNHDSEDYLPSALSATIKEFIAREYPNARIVEMDSERGRMEVDIIHDNKSKELLFSAEGEWISTSWDVRIADVPELVKSAALAKYPGYVIDDAEYVETPAGDYYLIEMEKGEAEVPVKVTEEGTVL